MLITLHRLSRRLALQHISCLVIALGTIIVHICLLRVTLFSGQGHADMALASRDSVSSVFRFSIGKDGAKLVRREVVFEVADNSADNTVYKLMDRDGARGGGGGGGKDTLAKVNKDANNARPASSALASAPAALLPASSSGNRTLLQNTSSSAAVVQGNSKLIQQPQQVDDTALRLPEPFVAAVAAAAAVSDASEADKPLVPAVKLDVKPVVQMSSSSRNASAAAAAVAQPAAPVASVKTNSTALKASSSSSSSAAAAAPPRKVKAANSLKKGAPAVVPPKPRPTISPRIRINRRGSWQCQSLASKKQPNDELCVYSAIYDARKEIGGKPTVRIAALSTIKQEDLSPSIWCQFLAVDASKNVRMTPVGNVSDVQITRVGRGHRVQTKPSTVPSSKQVNMLYAQVMISCLLPPVAPGNASSITHVSLVSNMSQSTTNLLQIYRHDPVVNPNPNSTANRAPANASAAVADPTLYEHEFGICVPISFGFIDPILLINWVEMNKLLGVTEINIYNASMTSDADAVFNHYRGLIVIHQMVPPVPDRTYGGVKLGSPAGLNDCMYRNMHRYRYVIIVDFDEVITPRPDVNYASLMIQIDSSRQTTNRMIHSYSTKNAYFYLTYPPDNTYPPWQPYQRYRTRFDSKAVSVFDKSFLNPRLCLSAFNHYCYIPLPNTARLSIQTSLATVHHYTGCKKKCELMNSSAVLDDVMLRYGAYVSKIVPTLAEQLNLRLPPAASTLSSFASSRL